MDFIKDAISGAGQQQQQQQPQQGGINLADGLDLSDVKGLASAFAQTRNDPNMNEEDPSQVAQMFGGEQQTGNAISKLTALFSQETGRNFSGSSEDNDLLSTIAHKVTGTNIPPSMLFKMAKMAGYI